MYRFTQSKNYIRLPEFKFQKADTSGLFQFNVNNIKVCDLVKIKKSFVS